MVEKVKSVRPLAESQTYVMALISDAVGYRYRNALQEFAHSAFIERQQLDAMKEAHVVEGEILRNHAAVRRQLMQKKRTALGYLMWRGLFSRNPIAKSSAMAGAANVRIYRHVANEVAAQLNERFSKGQRIKVRLAPLAWMPKVVFPQVQEKITGMICGVG
jgi:hypothetical protein